MAAAALGLWLWLAPHGAPALPHAVAPSGGAAAADETSAAQPELERVPGDAPQAGSRSDAAPESGDAPPVELWVRLVETVTLQPRPGELRPTQRGVPGMQVRWDGTQSAVSDADGMARFTDLAPRAGLLQVEPQGGLHGWSGTLDLGAPSGGLRRAGLRLTYAIELRPNLGFFSGFVVDSAGAPVAGAWVALVRGSDGSRRSPADPDLLAPAQESAADGTFQLSRVQGEERLELLVVCQRAGLPAGHVRQIGPNELSSRTPLAVLLPPARAVRVRVLERDGAAAAGALCLERDGALWPGRCEPRLAHTGAPRAAAEQDGTLEIELDDGAWVVHFLPHRPGEPRRLFQFTLAPDGASEFEFRLP